MLTKHLCQTMTIVIGKFSIIHILIQKRPIFIQFQIMCHIFITLSPGNHMIHWIWFVLNDLYISKWFICMWITFMHLLCVWLTFTHLLCMWLTFIHLLCMWLTFMYLLRMWLTFMYLLCMWLTFIHLLCMWLTIMHLLCVCDSLS